MDSCGNCKHIIEDYDGCSCDFFVECVGVRSHNICKHHKSITENYETVDTEHLTIKTEIKMKFDSYLSEINWNDDNVDLMDFVFEDGFILWNKTQNIAYEISDNPNDLFMDGFESESEDKIYILDIKNNKLIEFKG